MCTYLIFVSNMFPIDLVLLFIIILKFITNLSFIKIKNRV